jgi:hypothetical protein
VTAGNLVELAVDQAEQLVSRAGSPLRTARSTDVTSTGASMQRPTCGRSRKVRGYWYAKWMNFSVRKGVNSGPGNASVLRRHTARCSSGPHAVQKYLGRVLGCAGQRPARGAWRCATSAPEVRERRLVLQTRVPPPTRTGRWHEGLVFSPRSICHTSEPRAPAPWRSL